MVKNPPASARDARDTSLIARSGRSFVGRHGKPLLYYLIYFFSKHILASVLSLS